MQHTVPSGLPNHWIFRVRHVPLDPPGDLVVAVHPQSYFQLQAGPAQILSLPTSAERAEALIPYLLEAFIVGDADRGASWAPWSWATDDQEMATALEVKLREHGIPEELCTVSICTPAEKEIIGEAWSSLVGTLMKVLGKDARTKKASQQIQPGDDSKCHECKKSGSVLTEALKKCAACAKAWYCSQDCQNKNWKSHKPTCLANRPASNRAATASSSRNIGSFQDMINYHTTVAHTVPEARGLAKSLNLSLPTSMDTFEGTGKPIRRLVVTGKDTSENMELLFGPSWSNHLKTQLDEARFNVLLNPPRGSPSYAMNSRLDNGAPSWSPRPAGDDEKQKIVEVREMQSKIRERVGNGRSPSRDDMREILMSFGAAWDQKAEVYTLALNTMDQGVAPLE
ncbi:hypothetical protein PRZ48_007711 [Zasmidium cellare]|uniref:MYND-type domain-containing protein n=1 Tax=Zasmidium cellare TaxID=395010 RepID=A0ABR0EK19_ZASCE|nr:hypothetical protein PRZ48_007711 [Zasmidium cellare]